MTPAANGGDTPGIVLVVDDDLDVRETLAEVLRDEGFSVATATDGDKALALLADGLRPTLILLDLLMPRLGGREFRRLQLADPAIAGVPVIVLSASHGGADVVRDLAVDGALGKPIDLDDLTEVIERYCERRPR